MPRATVHTIGCRLNQAETAVLADRLRERGWELVPFGQPTELLVLNTCAVTEHAEADCRYAIRRTLRRSPHAFVAVTGCYAQTGAEGLQRLPGLDLIVGTQYKMRLPEYLPDPASLRKAGTAQLLHTRRIDRDDFTVPGVGDYSGQRAQLKIQDGCDFMCAFCLIPFSRGHERSRDLGDLLREAGELVARGHRELVLTGVNLGRYRQGEADLLEVIRRLEAIPQLERIRISSIEPTTVPDALLRHMADSPKLCRHLHLPLQSGDDGILQAMRRRYRTSEYRAFLERALAAVPELGLGTDVLVGFPGETEEAFERTVALVRELPFSYVHVFSYSPRPGTAAARLPGRVPGHEIRARSRRLAELARSKRVGYYRRAIGRTVRVLFESRSEDGSWTGLTDNYIRVAVHSGTPLTNMFGTVAVRAATDGAALGDLTSIETGSAAGHRPPPHDRPGRRPLPVLRVAPALPPLEHESASAT